MSAGHSPLRYPGGKQILGRILSHLIRINGRVGGVYVEPYCGGAGAALGLLFDEYVDRLMLNDGDPAVFAFWRAVLSDTDALLRLLRDTPLTVDEWRRQRDIYRRPGEHEGTTLGFATFYLNRCNRSGIIANAGLIGGLEQAGPWKLDARFNRVELAERIERVAMYRERIDLTNLDAIDFLREHVSTPKVVDRAFVYLDPPYYVKGSELYLNHYKPDDHAVLAKYLKAAPFQWVMTYDNVDEVCRLYPRNRQIPFDLNYSARDRKVGREVMILRPYTKFPSAWRERIPDEVISSSSRVSMPGA
jgi:DNA adenine methylase